MNDENYQLADKYVSHGYVQQGREARRVLEKNIRVLLEQGKVPSVGWNELSIKHLLQEISLMDSNNFPDNCGVGEREARIACPLVAQRHFHLGHGIGRSGDIAEIQPKAAGSSLLAKLANSFALDVIKMQGVKSANSCLLVPVATGMALVLTMITLKERRPNAKYVIWPRIDQKSCFKSILTAGLEPIIVENKMVGDYLETDLDTIRHVIQNVGSENVLCVLTTTSCFAPRIPDKLEEVGQICKDSDVPHVINNAYGVQSSKCMHLIQQACRVGRVDAFIQSTDKNFMVPVGGAIIAGFDKTFIQAVGKMYPGRASASPIVDFFITMLSLGETGYAELLKERKELYEHLKTGLNAVTGKFGERAMEIKQNQISIAVTLGNIDALSSGEKKNVTEFGSYLFKRSVSGTRVVTPHDTKTIGRYTFTGWGAHHNSYPTSYLTAAAAVGTTKQDIDQFLKRLEKTFKLFIKEPVPTVLASSSLKSSPSAPSSISAAFADSNQLQQETPSSFGLLQQTENLRLPQPGGDLRPTKSMNDKTRNNNNESLSSSVLLSAAERQSQLTRPGSFSSYQNLLSHRQSTGSGGGAELPHPRDTYSLCSGTRSLGQYGRYGSDSSLVSRDYTTSSSRDSCGSSRDGLVGGRLKTDDIVQQLVIPGEIPPDKMSFLIDI